MFWSLKFFVVWVLWAVGLSYWTAGAQTSNLCFLQVALTLHFSIKLPSALQLFINTYRDWAAGAEGGLSKQLEF